MQKKDMNVGFMYARQRSKYNIPRPVVLLDLDRIWGFDRIAGEYRIDTGRMTPGRDYNYRHFGYLVLEGDEDLLRGIEPPVDVNNDTIKQFRVSLPDGVRLAVVNNRHLVGVWSVVKAEHDAEEVRRREHEKEQVEYRARLENEYASIQARATALGISVERIYSTRDRLDVSFADMVVLLDAAEASKG